jgi:hypothetical protein
MGGLDPPIQYFKVGVTYWKIGIAEAWMAGSRPAMVNFYGSGF